MIIVVYSSQIMPNTNKQYSWISLVHIPIPTQVSKTSSEYS